MEIEQGQITVEGFPLFALRGRAKDPSALVLALHGGGYDANYWHHPVVPDASLLHLGSMLGFDVVAVDRPGNARSRDPAPDGIALADQIEILFELLEQTRDGRDIPVFLIGHSLGGIVALKMAADPRAQKISGIEVAGVPLAFEPERVTATEAGLAALRNEGAGVMPEMKPDSRAAMFYGPAETFDPAVVAYGPTEHGPPVIEIEEVLAWLTGLDAICARISLPVNWTFASEEAASVYDREASPARVSGLFAHNPGLTVKTQQATGHNISLHHIGRAYHLRTLAYFEELRARG